MQISDERHWGRSPDSLAGDKKKILPHLKGYHEQNNMIAKGRNSKRSEKHKVVHRGFSVRYSLFNLVRCAG